MMLVDCFDGVPLFFVGFVFVKGQSTQLECTFAAQKKKHLRLKISTYHLIISSSVLMFDISL